MHLSYYLTETSSPFYNISLEQDGIALSLEIKLFSKRETAKHVIIRAKLVYEHAEYICSF